jgi:hypothetical protein
MGQALRAARALVIVLQALLATLLVASLYLFAATASIGDTDQPGISAFRLRLHPVLTVIMFAGSPLAAALLGSPAWRAAGRVGSRLAMTALIISVAFAGALAIARVTGPHCSAAPPAERVLEATLRYALRCPEFSYRSFTTPLITGLTSLVLVLIASRAQLERPSRDPSVGER